MKTDDPVVCHADRQGRPARPCGRSERPTKAIARIARCLHDAGAAATRQAGREIVVTGGDVVTGHDPATGKELWRGDGLNPDQRAVLPHRRLADRVRADVIYAPTPRASRCSRSRAGGARRRHDLAPGCGQFDERAGRADARHRRHYFYFVNDRGIVYCLDAKTGKEVYGPAAHQARHLQRLADSRRRQNLHHERGRADDRGQGGTDIRGARGERDQRIRPQLDCHQRRPGFQRGDKHLYAIGQRRKSPLSITEAQRRGQHRVTY